MDPFRNVPGEHTGSEHSSTEEAPTLGVVRPIGQAAQAGWTPCKRNVPRGHASQRPSEPSCCPEEHSSRHSERDVASANRVVCPSPQSSHPNDPS